MSWEKAAVHSKEAKTGGNFISLADDEDSMVFAVVGDPEFTDMFYDVKQNKYVPYTPAHKEAGETPSARFSINAFVISHTAQRKKSDVLGMRVFEMNNMTFTSILAVKEKYGLDTYLFEAKRKGAKGSNKMTIGVLPELPFDKWPLIKQADGTEIAILDLIKKTPLHDLKKAAADRNDAGDASTDMNSHAKAKAAAANGTAAAAPAAPASSDLDAETAAAIVARLKLLPKDKIQAFLGGFGVQQVKKIPAAKKADALAALDAAEGKAAPPPAAPEEVDPFA